MLTNMYAVLPKSTVLRDVEDLSYVRVWHSTVITNVQNERQSANFVGRWVTMK